MIIVGCDDMAVLIGVLIFIGFCVFVYFFIRHKIRKTLNRAGFQGMNLMDVIEEARLEDQEVPKSLSSMDRIYLENIRKDFPDISIEELKRNAESNLLDTYRAIEKKDSSSLKGKLKSFADKMISEYQGRDISFDEFHIHNTVISKYQKEGGVATITLASSFQYYFTEKGKRVKTQDRVREEYIYVYDMSKVDSNLKNLGIHCPNCGAPITTLGEKSCQYCGSTTIAFIGRIFTCNDIVRY